MEVLIPTPAIRHLIRDNKIHQIYSSMQMGQEKYGMITFNQSLASLYFKRDISLELAMSVSHNPGGIAGTDQPRPVTCCPASSRPANAAATAAGNKAH